MVRASQANMPDAVSVYDALGNRVAEKVNDVWQFVIYDAFGKLVAEYGGNPQQDAGGVKYYLQDWQGSVRAGVNAADFVRSRTDHQAFGEEIASGVGSRTTAQGFGAPKTNRQGYGLTEKDSATGLNHTWFRKNENRAGRWTSPDPYNGSASVGSPQSWNRYSYVESQPTNYVDPSGLNQNSGYFICYDIVTTGHYRNEPEHSYTFLTTKCIVFGGGNSGVGMIDPGGFGGGDDGDGGGNTPPNDENFDDCVKRHVNKALGRLEEDFVATLGESVVAAGLGIVTAVIIVAIIEPTAIGEAVVTVGAAAAVAAIVLLIFANKRYRDGVKRAIEDAIDDCNGKPGTPAVLPAVEKILEQVKDWGKRLV